MAQLKISAVCVRALVVRPADDELHAKILSSSGTWVTSPRAEWENACLRGCDFTIGRLKQLNGFKCAKMQHYLFTFVQFVHEKTYNKTHDE